MSQLEKSILEAEQMVKKAERIFSSRKEILYALKKASIVYCAFCESSLPVRDLTYIQYYRYVAPYGCTEGDYWTVSSASFECTSCGVENSLHEREDVVALKEYFKEVDKFYVNWDPIKGKTRAF